jgi:hypothetical protein
MTDFLNFFSDVLWTLSVDILSLKKNVPFSVHTIQVFRLWQLARQPQWSCHRPRGSQRLLRGLSQRLCFRYDASDNMTNAGVSKKRWYQ